MMGLTEKQAECLAAVHAFIAAEGRAPRYREIAERLDVNTSRVYALLSGLKERGFVDWMRGRRNTIELLPAAPRVFVLPEHLYAKLQRFCLDGGEDPCAVVADAVALHLDELDGRDLIPGAAVS